MSYYSPVSDTLESNENTEGVMAPSRCVLAFVALHPINYSAVSICSCTASCLRTQHVHICSSFFFYFSNVNLLNENLVWLRIAAKLRLVCLAVHTQRRDLTPETWTNVRFGAFTCLTSACRWRSCRLCSSLVCVCCAPTSTSCCFSWRNSRSSWTCEARSMSFSPVSSIPDTQTRCYSRTCIIDHE